MGVPRTYRKSGETAIASYDYTDIASGVGYQVFYLADDIDDNLFIVDRQIYSDDGRGASNSATADFVITFNSPRIVEGDIILNLPVFMFQNFGSTQSLTYRVTPVIKKNTTTLATGSQFDTGATSVATNTADFNFITYKLNITKTHFKIGDTLTLNLSQEFDSQQGSFSMGVFTEPTGVDRTEWNWNQTFLTSSSQMHIPFRLNL